MAVRFRLWKNKNSKSNGFNKWYGRSYTPDTVNTEMLAQKISARCTVTEMDTLAVLRGLSQVMTEEMQAGRRVTLDKIGAFKIALNTTGAQSEDKFSVTKNVKSLRVNFMPETRIKNGQRVTSMLFGATVAELPTDVDARKQANKQAAGEGE